MYISRIVVRNFRNFRALDVRVSPKVTCLIGENNTGKTNLLHALRLVADANLSSRYRELREMDFHTAVDIRSPEQVVISLDFADFKGKTNEEALLGPCAISGDLARLSYRFRPRARVREDLESGARTPGDLTLDDYHYEITGGGDKDPATIAWDDDLGTSIRFGDLQAYKVEHLAALRNVEEGLRTSASSPLARLLDTLGMTQEQRTALIAILENANDKIAEQPAIKDLGTAAQSSYSSTAGHAFEMNLRIGMVDPSFNSITRALTVLLSDGRLEDFETARNGLGLNNVLFISLLLEYFERRTKTASAAGELLLIEEPEAHLHPQLQRVLYHALREKPVQTILTTHSTHISSAAPLTSYLVLTNDGTPATASTALGAGFSPKQIADLERYLDATRSTLLYARKVILVEGPAELFLIPPLVREVLGIDLDSHGITIVPIYGTHFDVYAQLFGPSALRKKCAIICDADAELDGTDEDATYEATRFGPLKNAYVGLYSCWNTFERSLTIPGMLPPLAQTAREFGAKQLADALDEAIDLGVFPSPTSLPSSLESLRGDVLAAAKRFGKARFAQVLSKHVGLASAVPSYIRDAISWLIAP